MAFSCLLQLRSLKADCPFTHARLRSHRAILDALETGAFCHVHINIHKGFIGDHRTSWPRRLAGCYYMGLWSHAMLGRLRPLDGTVDLLMERCIHGYIFMGMRKAVRLCRRPSRQQSLTSRQFLAPGNIRITMRSTPNVCCI